MVAAVQAAEALKILSGASASASRELLAVDLWVNSVQRLRLDRAELSIDCPACARGVFEYLEMGRGAQTITLCGRNAVQIRPQRGTTADLDRIAARLRAHGAVQRNRFLLRVEIEGCVVALFPDGRAIISGTSDPARARSIYDRYVGA